MFIELKNGRILYIKNVHNTTGVTYILNKMDPKRKKLFDKIGRYYQNEYGLKKYYDPENKKYNKILTLTPNDFYYYAKDHDHIRPFMSENTYDSYQIYNILMVPETEKEARKNKWEEIKDPSLHNIHVNGTPNKKYLKEDLHGGYLEAVYGPNGRLVFDDINDGTYNQYYYPRFKHKLDVLWWICYGVYGKDDLNRVERIKQLFHHIKLKRNGYV